MPSASLAKRWTEGFDGGEIGVFRKKERECPACGCNDAIVLSGHKRGRDVTRRLRCDCGTAWTQVSVG